MSFSITEAFVQQYRDNVLILAQQRGSYLRNAVTVESGVVGKRTSFDRIGSTTPQKRTSRHADTPLVSTPHSRRWANLDDYDWADLVDKLDKVKMLISPESDYALNAGYAFGRTMDDIIISALRGTAVTGEVADGTQALPAGQKVAVGGTGLTIAKLRSAKLILDKNNIVSEDRFFVVNGESLSDLLATTEVTSSDFNTIRALVNGELDTFLGFKFLRTEQLPIITGTDRANLAFQKRALGLAMGEDITTRMSERDDKNYALQVYMCMSLGAVRIEDEAVVEVAVLE